MEQRIVKKKKEKKKEVEFLKYFFKLVGAFSVIYLDLPLSGWERCLKFKGKKSTARYLIHKNGTPSDGFAAWCLCAWHCV